MHKPQAILLLGPTGSGKTPLGERLQRTGLRGRRCAHFDFGRELRRIAAGGDRPGDLTGADAALLGEMLDTGGLLEDEHFRLAEAILRAFVAAHEPGEGDLIVLNGLPRHPGQAEALERLVDVRAVVHLSCPDEVAIERIGRDVGGDRCGRADDDAPAVRRKLALFARRSRPLLDHYRGRGVRVVTIEVRADTRAEDMCDVLDAPGQGHP
jgi:adenylate kinase family enzyme